METLDLLIYAIGAYLIIFVGILKIGLNSRKGQRMVGLVGEGIARVIYIVLGILLIVLHAIGVI